LNKKEFFASVFIGCFFAMLLNIAIAVNFADNIAEVIGYFLTVTLLPFILTIIPSLIILSISKAKLSTKQKWWLFLWPCILLAIIYIYFFFMLNYGGPL
jgi:hypothetical protein